MPLLTGIQLFSIDFHKKNIVVSSPSRTLPKVERGGASGYCYRLNEKNFVVNLQKFYENKQVRKIKHVWSHQIFFFCFNNDVTDFNIGDCG